MGKTRPCIPKEVEAWLNPALAYLVHRPCPPGFLPLHARGSIPNPSSFCPSVVPIPCHSASGREVGWGWIHEHGEEETHLLSVQAWFPFLPPSTRPISRPLME